MSIQFVHPSSSSMVDMLGVIAGRARGNFLVNNKPEIGSEWSVSWLWIRLERMENAIEDCRSSNRHLAFSELAAVRGAEDK
jgi:hypothetical protein